MFSFNTPAINVIRSVLFVGEIDSEIIAITNAFGGARARSAHVALPMEITTRNEIII